MTTRRSFLLCTAALLAAPAYSDDGGAVKGAVDDVKLGNLTATLANIRPSVAKVANLMETFDSLSY